jgi:hypothetical protein
MAGKRQHYVPRLLQRGFLDAFALDGERTWLHRRGVGAKLVGIRDIGVEDWFYSRESLDGTRTLDDAIRDLESDLGPSIRALRASAPRSPVDAAEAARTVVHLVMRTDHLRRIMSAGITGVTREIAAAFTNPARLGEMLGRSRPAFASSVVGAIRDSVGELLAVGVPADLSERLIAFAVREHADRIVARSVTLFGPILQQMLCVFVDQVREAHNAALAKLAEGNEWETSLAAFQWAVEAGVDLILPDAVALAYEDDNRPRPLLFTNAVDARVVVMPLSADRMLVGRATGSPPIDFADFNSQAAASCEAFFIAAKSFNEQKLHTLIGSAAANAIDDAMSAAMRQTEQARPALAISIARVKPNPATQQQFSFSVRLLDFGDETLAKALAELLQGVVTELAHHLPLHDLDGFTLAGNYRRALATVDRGDPDLPPVTSGALEYGVGVAKPVTVIRNGARKEHLVMAADLAQTWLSSDANVRATGLHMLVKMLAGIAHSTRYAGALSTRFAPDAMARKFHLAVASTPAGYWSARYAAFVRPDQGQICSDLVIEGLDFAKREIADERARIRENGDISAAMMRALHCVSAILEHAAEWLGHRDGLADGQLFAGSDLPERLKIRGLDNWIELFGRDLAACYTPEDNLNVEIVANLSPHVERLLWGLDIYCWPENDDVHCLVTDKLFLPPRLFDDAQDCNHAPV